MFRMTMSNDLHEWSVTLENEDDYESWDQLLMEFFHGVSGMGFLVDLHKLDAIIKTAQNITPLVHKLEESGGDIDEVLEDDDTGWRRVVEGYEFRPGDILKDKDGDICEVLCIEIETLRDLLVVKYPYPYGELTIDTDFITHHKVV